MNTNFEYFRAIMKGGENIPLFAQLNESPDYTLEKKHVEYPEKVLIGFGDPVPLKPRLVDWHFESKSIISQKIFDVITPFKIENIQLFPAIIKNRKNEVISENYYYLHSFNRIKCVDKVLSECAFGRRLRNIKKIILDKTLLAGIPLKNRLIFRLKEDRGFQLFHSSIVDVVMELKPEGVQFVNIEDWTMKSY